MSHRPDDSLPIGRRIQWYRERAGMTRPVLAQLVDRSPSWLKGVEIGRLQPPRLPMLLRIADALGLADLADLTGNGHAVPVSVYAGERHPALADVQAALTEYRISPAGREVSVPHLRQRLTRAWQIRHSSPDHRTQLGLILPDLIRDTQQAVRATRSEERRDARRVLGGVYALADFYVAYQPAPELVWLCADRALTEGQEADDPYCIASGAWAMIQALRDSGRWDEALGLAHDAIGQLTPHLDGAPDDWRGMVGALEAEIALTHARRGRRGDAWGAFERADAIARTLGPNYRHVQSSFSAPTMAAHATTLGVDLRRPGEAMRAAESIDADTIASVPRRARHLIEHARAAHQRDERVATLALLDRSERTASETIRYNGWARELIRDLRQRPPSGMRDDVADLAHRVGIAA